MTIQIGDSVEDCEGKRLGKVAAIIEREGGRYLQIREPKTGRYHFIFVPRGEPSFEIEREHVDSLQGWLDAGAKLH
jgi:hypothetical protein